MMRKAAAFLLLLLAPQTAVLADTPIETVIVNANTLAGVWKIAMPNQVTKDGFFGAIKFGPLHDHFLPNWTTARWADDQLPAGWSGRHSHR